MIHDITQSIYPSIRQWEGAGAAVANALTRYLELSFSLETKALAEGMPPNDLATRIDSTLGSMRASLDRQISRVRSALSQTRNRILSPIYRLPREILSEIFMNIIFADPDLPEPEGMEDSVSRMCLALHNLLDVCNEWRNVALTRGELWSIIMVLDLPSCEGIWKRLDYALPCGIERSKRDLYLVATRPYDPLYGRVLTMLAPRFRAVNISTDNQSTVQQIINIFLSPGSSEPLALSHLSIYQDQDASHFNHLPPEWSYIFALGSPEQESFENLTPNLSVLRVRGAQFHWDRFNFSQKLTEVYLQELVFGYDITALNFISALSSASELRVLKLISVRTFYAGPSDYVTPVTLKVQLPNLQTLLLDDLYFNTLDCFLSSVTSRTHSLTLLLSARCRRIDLEPSGSREIDLEILYELLRKVSVNDLLLAGDLHRPWLSSLKLRELMKCISAVDLETLRVNSWSLDATCCNALAYHSLSGDSSSSHLVNLHITRSRVPDEKELIDMVNSHSDSVRRMKLGAEVYNRTRGMWVRLEEDQSVALALKNSVPNFQVVNSNFTPPEFGDPKWQLW